ncbi:MAG: M50 family metallopeptidase [Coriobacteriaceae bacterium]|nr:M50 family metallopeptidase [Coriobacteriaceae bacterium]
MDVVLTIFWGLVVLIILVFVHELGHFLFARLFGARVTEFMIGMPGPNIGFERNGCRYGITCIPLGGYNRITGMEGGPEDPNLSKVLAYVYRHGKADVEHTAMACDLDTGEAENALIILDGWGSIKKPARSDKSGLYSAPQTDTYELGEPREVDDETALLDGERAQTYRGLKFWQRLCVLFAGPVFNVVFALIIFIVLLSGIGVTSATTTLEDVIADSPAQVAGLEAGDTITALDGVETPDWETLSDEIASLTVGEDVTVSYVRDDEPETTELTVGAREDGTPQLGVYMATAPERVSVFRALGDSFVYIGQTVAAYASLFNPMTAAETVSESTSVVGIAVMSREAASASPLLLLYLLAAVSLSLGIVNLIPLPPLDGGKIVVEVIQKIIRRDIPASVINAITVVVIALLIVLFLILLNQDIHNFILGT